MRLQKEGLNGKVKSRTATSLSMAAATLVLVTSLGCGPAVRDRNRPVTDRSAAADPARSSNSHASYPATGAPPAVRSQGSTSYGSAGALDQRRLVALNSILIPPPFLSSAPRDLYPRREDFYQALQAAIEKQLSLDHRYIDARESVRISMDAEAAWTELLVQAKRTGQDAVMLSRVNEYVERQGSAIAADRPAAVDLDITIRSTVDGTIIWRQAFHVSEASLSQNLLTVGGAESSNTGTFRSASALMRLGFDTMLSKLESDRMKAFTQ